MSHEREAELRIGRAGNYLDIVAHKEDGTDLDLYVRMAQVEATNALAEAILHLKDD